MPGRRSACSSRRRLDRTGRWRHGRRSTRALRPSGSGNSARAGSTRGSFATWQSTRRRERSAAAAAALTKSGRSDMSALMLRRAMTGLSSLAWLGALSRNGRANTYMDGDGRVVLADSASGERIRTLLEPDDAIVPGLVAISPDASSTVAVREMADGVTELAVSGRGATSTVLRLGAGDAVSLSNGRCPTAFSVRSIGGRQRIGAIRRHQPEYLARVAAPVEGFDAARAVAGRHPAGVRWAGAVRAGVTRCLPCHGTCRRDHTPGRGRRAACVGSLGRLPAVPEQPHRHHWCLGRAGIRQRRTRRASTPPTGPGPGRFGHRHVGRHLLLQSPNRTRGCVHGAAGRARPSCRTPRGAARSFVGSNMGPGFSPDGRTVVFLAQSGFSSREALGIREVESNAYRILATGMRYLCTPRWS